MSDAHWLISSSKFEMVQMEWFAEMELHTIRIIMIIIIIVIGQSI